MEADLSQQRRQAHALLDMLPAGKLNAVRSLLDVMVDPVSRALANAPIDDEPITEEEERAVAEAASGSSIIRGFRLNNWSSNSTSPWRKSKTTRTPRDQARRRLRPGPSRSGAMPNHAVHLFRHIDFLHRLN
jgi:hypothetical protein